ncbi:MAG: multifunctional CCA tRNA nucleotidyl transferase/2'3'-cyclic phosphodiesterase/2'nucleotidase/phosphatase [Legionellaceae bacterium]|nr:multifunctional CCA tRNA nucleotidyl transferase/2'3'-cyclic phosphodiesterase/2'nucleotidase/phosphatase [Legionellaceae bacterium]
MKVYLVGGAVRDRLLGRPHKENDWVVVGSTPEEMAEQGFRPVGKDFPVFLHPETHEEYALARTERKTSKGYHGFVFHAAPDVTLEEDLKRRDLTMNAIAQNDQGKLIDPFDGKRDIENKLFRHVSSAFEEDPVRLLRVCRFSAMLPDFNTAPETLELMKNMVKAGEVDALVPERVWQELKQALGYERPDQFFETAARCGALKTIFSEIKEISTTLSALKKAAELSDDAHVRFAAAFGQLSPGDAKQLCQRLRIPNNYAGLLQLVANHHSAIESLPDSPGDILNLLEKLDPFRRPERFERCLLATDAIYRSKHNKALPTLDLLNKAYKVCKTVNLDNIDKQSSGTEIAETIRKLRLDKIKEALK